MIKTQYDIDKNKIINVLDIWENLNFENLLKLTDIPIKQLIIIIPILIKNGYIIFKNNEFKLTKNQKLKNNKNNWW